MNLFFDLDGTLTDSAPGIVLCINHALTELGVSCPPHERVRGLIGSPLQAIFERLLESSDPQQVARAIAAYRDRFGTTGMFENAVFSGIPEALQELRRCGHHLQIVTVKPAVIARRVVEHFRLAEYFATVHGPAPDDENCNKADFVAAALKCAGGGPENALMIGDRVDDVLAARAHGVPAAGVAWGYGTRDELLAAGAACVVNTSEELIACIQARSGLSTGSHDLKRHEPL